MSAQRKKSKRSFESIRRRVIQTTAKAWNLDEASTSPGGISRKSDTRVRRNTASHGNPPVGSGLSEVEFSPMEEVLHEEVPF